MKPILGLAEKGIRLEGQLDRPGGLDAPHLRLHHESGTENSASGEKECAGKNFQKSAAGSVDGKRRRQRSRRWNESIRLPGIRESTRSGLAGRQTGQESWITAAAQKELGLTAATARKLTELGLIRMESDTIFRNPVRPSEVQAHPFTLYPAQQAIVEDVAARAAAGDLRPALIHGVTGSGKTEVYMELIAAVLEQGKEAIVLIPEIALTFQTVLRFYRRFGDQVSIIHSKLSAGERYDQFERARRGEVKVMIGPRSALFTPFSQAGNHRHRRGA